MSNKTIFHKNGAIYTPHGEQSLEVVRVLPGGNYTVCHHPLRGYFLEESEPFEMPPKLYGNTVKHTKRILNTFNNTERGDKLMGVLLAGEKGSGKTLLAKNLCVQSKMPVLLVTAPYHDEGFLKLISSIEQPCIIFFDEFEKIYSDQKVQESMLTLFDGVYSSTKKLAVATVNNKWALREFFHNRPSRLFYNISFEGLTVEFIREYCKDRLNDQNRTEEVIKTALSCGSFNFDMLQALVMELNTYPDDTIEEVIEVLNVKPYSAAGTTKYRAHVVVPSMPQLNIICNTTLNMTPLAYQVNNRDTFNVQFLCEEAPNLLPNTGDDWEPKVRIHEHFSLAQSDLKEVSTDGLTYVYKGNVHVGDYGYEYLDVVVTFTPEIKGSMFGSWSYMGDIHDRGRAF